jgi:hypothetical protein
LPGSQLLAPGRGSKLVGNVCASREQQKPRPSAQLLVQLIWLFCMCARAHMGCSTDHMQSTHCAYTPLPCSRSSQFLAAVPS